MFYRCQYEVKENEPSRIAFVEERIKMDLAKAAMQDVVTVKKEGYGCMLIEAQVIVLHKEQIDHIKGMLTILDGHIGAKSVTDQIRRELDRM